MKFNHCCAVAVLLLSFAASSTMATPNYNMRSADHPTSNAGSSTGSATRNLRGARALATTSSGTIVYTENGGDTSSSSTSTSSHGNDASQVVGAFATTAGLVIAMSAYLL
nr:RxLR effector protein 70 [Phytophthora cinnamomi]